MMRSSEFSQETTKKQQEDYEECVIHRDYTHLPKVSDKDVGLSSS